VSGGVAILYREAVTGLSPGWRLGGTLGIGSNKRVALKERKNRSNEMRALLPALTQESVVGDQ